ncbi:unnamed protein product [Orchesella dallaii]
MEGLESGTWQLIGELMVLLELLSHVVFLGYGVIIKGMKPMMMTWIIIESIFMLLYEIQLIWFLIEVLSLPTFRAKVTLLLVYLLIYNIAYYCYQIHLAVQCLPLFQSIVELEPIGKGFGFIFEYFRTHAKAGASLALMSELMMNFHVFLERHVIEYGLGFNFLEDEIDRSVALTIEETFVRYFRVGVCIVGFYLTFKEKQIWMFNWCLAYLITLTFSFGIFVYMIFMWRAVHGFLTLVYFTAFTINLLYRTGVLYACVRYTDVFERQGIPM